LAFSASLIIFSELFQKILHIQRNLEKALWGSVTYCTLILNLHSLAQRHT